MKKRSKLVSAVLVAAMVVCSAFPAFAAPAADGYHIELTQVAEFSMEGIDTYYDSFIEMAGENEAYVYDINGRKIFPDAVQSSDYLEKGMYQYKKANSTDPNSTALVSSGGKVLLPFEYAFYQWPDHSACQANKRFILAFYGTEVTDDEDDFLFYTTDDLFAFGGPDEGDTLYKGYVKIYDIQKEKFVDNLQFEHYDRYDTVSIVGNSIVVQNEDKTHTMYDADGKKILDLNSRVECTDTLVIENSETNSGCRAYDDNGIEVFKTGIRLSPLTYSTSGYLTGYQDGKEYVFDQSGKELFSTDHSVSEESYDIFRTREDDKYVLYDASGKELASTNGDYESLSYGRFLLETAAETYTLTGPSGILAEGVTKDYHCLVKDGSIITLNDGTEFIPYDSDAYFAEYHGVLCVKSSGDDAYALYDPFTGEKLIDDGFYDARELGDHLVLTYRDGPDYTYKTYDVNIVEGK